MIYKNQQTVYQTEQMNPLGYSKKKAPKAYQFVTKFLQNRRRQMIWGVASIFAMFPDRKL